MIAPSQLLYPKPFFCASKGGKRLSHAEIAQVRGETRLLKALESAAKFETKWSGEQSFKDIV
jgi:hypothetical protein